MPQFRRIFINSLMSLLQVLFVGAVLLILYGYILRTIGIQQLGIWSLILATTSALQISNFGLSGSVVKYVAKYAAREDTESVCRIVQTASVSIGALAAVALFAGYPLIKAILRMIMDPASLELGTQILPAALLSLWMNMVAGILQAGIDGLQRIYYRNLLMISGSVVFTILCFVLAPRKGLVGLAYAQVINSGFLLVASWVIIRKLIPDLPLVFNHWDRGSFKEIIKYGFNFQVITAVLMLYDPTTKALLSRFGGMSLVGFYEMASRMIQQFRAIIVSASQVLVPAIAEIDEKGEERIECLYLRSHKLLVYLSMPLYCLIILASPVISRLWIGYYERTFVALCVLLAIGWFINTLNISAYFFYLGIGKLRWNVVGHLIIGLLNIILGVIFGYLFSGYGVVLAWIISLAIGSLIIIFSFHSIYNISISNVIPSESRFIAICYLIILISFLLLQSRIISIVTLPSGYMLVAFGLISILAVGLPFWFHSGRKELVLLVKRGISGLKN